MRVLMRVVYLTPCEAYDDGRVCRCSVTSRTISLPDYFTLDKTIFPFIRVGVFPSWWYRRTRRLGDSSDIGMFEYTELNSKKRKVDAAG